MLTPREIGRRELLGAMGLGGIVAGTGGLVGLSGCSSDDAVSTTSGSTGTISETSTATSTIATTSSVPPFDPARPYWQQGNFVAVEVESTIDRLDVSGSIPPEISGLFVRNGSNPRRNDSAHWFLGDGMLHGVRFENGRASWYRNRAVATALHAAGKDLFDFGGVPGKEFGQSNVALVHHGGRLLTTDEVAWPHEIDPSDLSTVGPWNFGGLLGDSMTAHPKVDPDTGRMHFFGYSFLEPGITYYVAEPDGSISHTTRIALDQAVMIHDFAITDRDALFWLGPVLFGPDPDALYPQVPFHWDPDGPARVGVMPLGGDGDQIRWVDVDPFFVFHGLNARRDGDDVVAHVHRLPETFGRRGDLVASHLTEWRIGTGGQQLTFAEQRVSELPMDLPTHDRRHTGRGSRHGWCVTTTDPDGEFGMELAGICHIDTKTGREDLWDPPDHLRGGEAVFIPTGDAEGEGYVTTFVWDRSTNRSNLAIFDAQHVSNGPVAEVHLPVRVPFGFHGLWIDDADLV
ncbi:MAG TPA: carotenoid oxygenase family protein [Microthrixaceae bacterium]|nr:carotenoid oxygenase family protein [Microthrixaceae bacterium]